MASETRDYKGRRITLSEPEGRLEDAVAVEPVLRIDGEAVGYGQLPGGSYFLDDYYYDWADDLIEVAERFIDYQERVEVARRRNRPDDRDGEG